MSISDKLTKLSTDLTNAYNSIEDKGGTIPTNKNTENLASAIETITGGGGVTAYTVTFDSNGGSEVPSQQIASGYTAKEPDAPTKEGYKFKYWALNGGDEYDFNTPVTNDIYLIAVWRKILVPEDCIELEYIESTGAQYIDTGIVPGSSTRIVIETQFTSISTSQAMGWMSRGEEEAFGFGVHDETMNFSIFVSNETNITITGMPADGDKHIFDLQSGSQKLDGIELSTNIVGDTAITNQTMYLFALHGEWITTNNGATSFCKVRVFNCKIYDNDLLIRNFIPILDSNNVACFYDSVSKTFFYNRKTSSFTAGPVIS